ncbi:MAG: esterase-like activity of phytase family protein [Phycisphaerae bacterium]
MQAWSAAAAAPALTASPVGVYALPAGSADAKELSGLAYLGGNSYLSVSDASPTAFPLTISLDPVTGVVLSAAVVGAHPLAAGTDLEGIAPGDAGSVYVADEGAGTIRRHRLGDGAVLDSLAVPGVYGSARANLGLESLTHRNGVIWTANEQALTVDGGVATTSAGTVVRLQRFDTTGSAAEQYAYVTEPIDSTFGGREQVVLTDLHRLPSGRLIALEREVNGNGALLGQMEARVYELDLSGATDVSGMAALDGAVYTPVVKHLLWEGAWTYPAYRNFEGLTLGPSLVGGGFALLLVSDDGQGEAYQTQSLQVLRLSGEVALPGDVSLDGKVSLADLSTLAGHWGTTAAAHWESGDLTGDGAVSLADLSELAAHWGAGSSPAAKAVPEPSVMVLLAVGAFLAMLRRRSHIKG